MQLADSKDIKNVNNLSIYLDYKSPEKLYRLERNPNAKPSFDILVDISNKFEFANMNWLITGNGEMETNDYSITKKHYVLGDDTGKYEKTNEIENLKRDLKRKNSHIDFLEEALEDCKKKLTSKGGTIRSES